MAAVQATQSELMSRGVDIQRFLRPISKLAMGPSWSYKPHRTTLAVGASDGSPPSSDVREWRFSTSAVGVVAAYYERWVQADGAEDLWYLAQAYLSLYRRDALTEEETELLCLHCDPNDEEGNPHWKYKRGPHLHISAGPSPFPKAHIALHCGHVDQILESVDSLTYALGHAVQMIRDEVLDAMGAH